MSHVVTNNSKYPDVQDYTDNNRPQLLQSIVRTIRNIMQGKTNNTYYVSLTANSATTTVSVAQHDIGPLSTILFMPITANAATEFGAGTMYVSAITIDAVAGTYQFTITHVNNAQTDRNFRFTIVG